MCDTITGLVHMHHSLPEPLLHRNLSPADLLVSSASRRVATLAASGAGAGATAANPSCCWADVVVKLGGLGSVPEGHDHYPQAPLHGVHDAPGDVYAWAKCMCLVVMDALLALRLELRTGLVVRLRRLRACAWDAERA
jgi:hypothetical protein